MNAPKGWHCLSYQWIKDFQLFLFILITLSLFRTLLIVIFHNKASDDTTFYDYLSAFWMGFRVDMGTAAAWVLLTFLISIGCSLFSMGSFVSRIRKYSAALFVIVAVLILGIDLIFFSVYGDHYNQMLLGLIYDDAAAIATTIWKEHHPLVYIPIFIILIYYLLKLISNWMKYDLAIIDTLGDVESHLKKTGLFFVFVFLFMFAIRGGDISGAPLQMRHIFVTNDGFLNRAILNPLFALRHTIKNQIALNSKNGLSVFWDPNELPQALSLIATAKTTDTLNIDQAIVKTAPGFPKAKPKHVFFILMESYSGWTLLPEYQSIGLSNGLLPYAKSGVNFGNFLSATRATADSLSCLVSGLPYAGLNINHEPGALKQFPTSIAKIFKDLGYKTRFIYGGYIGWQRLDTFIKAQGFDEIYSAADIKTPTTGNEWGVDDEYMFQQAESLIDDDMPSFNFILSTTSHSPYDLDLEKLGYPVKSFPASVIAVQKNAVEVMGHHWYADRELGKFLKIMNNKLEKPLFAITGDHSARVGLRFPQGTSRDGSIVPFVLYGPEILEPSNHSPSLAGGHQDIIPTLVNLSAPKGFSYPAFGKDMLSKKEQDVGVGLTQMIGSNFIMPLNQSTDVEVFNGDKPVLNEQQRNRALKRINAMRAISWYRVRKDNTLPSQTTTKQ